jgi:alanyl-tRNA synthetase
LVEAVIETMSGAYPEIREKAAWITEVAVAEEERFARTLEAGLEILDGVIAEVRRQQGAVIPGIEVFRLYDTYGFPPDLTRIVAEEHELTIDRAGFEEAMNDQRARARAGAGFNVAEEGEHYRRLDLPATAFCGFEGTEGHGRVLAIVADGVPTERAVAGASVQVVLDRTPFYAEAGGQVGDTGEILVEGASGRARVVVENTHRPVAGIVVHHGTLAEGVLAVGDEAEARVDATRRLDIQRNHTATHLLHHALQSQLGAHAQQRGSLVAPERLRFDFAHLKGLEAEELEAIEAAVNRMVRADSEVRWREMAMDEARRLGATMLFGEKYGDEVRVVEIDAVSRELCGGTHLERTGQIGAFVLTGESSVGAGLRRIEALTGRAAEAEIRERGRRLRRLGEQVGAQTAEQLESRVADLVAQQREHSRALDQARAQLAARGAASLVDGAVEVGGAKLVAARVDVADTDDLRGQADALRDALVEGVIVLAAQIEDKPRLLVAVTDGLLPRGAHAGKLVKTLAAHIGGGGGGRPNLAEAGGRDVAGLDAALEAAAGALAAQLGEDGGA